MTQITEIETARWTGCYGGGRGDLFTPESNRHPAKMAVGLCYRIFEHGRARGYWKPGDVILDPMAGIGTTLICGATLGYRVLGVELESHFIDLAWDNILSCSQRVPGSGKNFVATGRVPPFGIVQGDARRLSEILNLKSSLAAAVTSPPYADQQVSGDSNFLHAAGRGNPAKAHRLDGYSGVVTSPPYGEALQSEHGIDLDKIKRPEGPNSQSRLPSNYSGAITSPPYADSVGTDTTHGQNSQAAKASRQFRQDPYSGGIENPKSKIQNGQIGNLRDPRNDINRIQESGFRSQENGGDTYLSAMLAVYRELHAVLKPHGVVCLVTKNPVKKGAIRRLDDDTIRLMAAAGFELLERARAMLAEDLGCQTDFWRGDQHVRREKKSFFKRLFERKRPDLKVDHEDVLFFRSAEATDSIGEICG